MVDIIIVSTPGIGSNTPQAAPALLKGSVESAGFSCKTVDFNLRLYQTFKKDVDRFNSYFMTGLNIEVEEQAKLFVENCAKELVEMNPKYIGLSVFTYQNKISTRLFCEYIKKISNIPIVLGGQGLSNGGLEGQSSFGQTLFNEGLADYWIKSEGEVSLVELLKGNTAYPGINSNSFQQIEDLNTIPFPNYDDYDLASYRDIVLPITGSRGCIRSCTFCDIHEHWKYRFRKGDNIAEEILYLSNKYNVTNFNFSDSLINGSLKEFNQFIKILAEHNKTATAPISWRSQFIVRSPNQVSEEYWKTIAAAGAQDLAIGVETGSDKVRVDMNKKFTNSDLDYTMEMFAKYNISCLFLMIIGYPTETDEDFAQTLEMFERYQKYAGHIIKNVAIGTTLAILPGTELYRSAGNMNIELDKNENNWVAFDNPTCTLEKRIERRMQLRDHLIKLKYPLLDDSADQVFEVMKSNLPLLNTRTKIKKMMRIKQQARVQISA